MKRKVLPPDIVSNFRWKERYYNFSNNFYFNVHIFNNLFFFFVLTLGSIAIGFWIHDFWALALCLLGYSVYAWMRTRRLAYGLQIRRLHKKKGREMQEFEITYEISNDSGFDLPPFSFLQKFTGVQSGSFEVKSMRTIPPQTKIRVTCNVVLDSGMGVKEIGDFGVQISDELSLFPFEIEFAGTKEIEVAPLILETPLLKKSISPDSTEFGFYDIQKRGESNLFIGTREYRYGDPVKNINWKLSRKTSKLIVNEFEKNTNTYVTLLLDLELTSQVGMGALSTWEAAKDLALSIAANEIKLRNYVQVLAQNLHVPFGTGHSQMLTIERHFTYHELSSSGLDHLNHLQGLPWKSQIYFFCPLLGTLKIQETLGVLKRLRLLEHSVTVFGIDPYQDIRKAVSTEAHTPFTLTGVQARKEFQAITEDLKHHGIEFIKVDVREKEKLSDMLVKRARHILEERT
ncbi:MAG: DUF58 domain-containing protein [Bacteriovoracaceae bacterium]